MTDLSSLQSDLASFGSAGDRLVNLDLYYLSFDDLSLLSNPYTYQNEFKSASSHWILGLNQVSQNFLELWNYDFDELRRLKNLEI